MLISDIKLNLKNEMALPLDMKCSNSEFPVEKDKLCLFCYKSIPPDGNASLGNVSEGEEIGNLGRNGIVTRFVKLLEGFLGEKIKISGCDKWLNCCGDCEITLESYCEVYHQWKCLELQVQWKLGKLMNLMKFANRVPSRIQQLKLVLEEGESVNEIGRERLKNFKGFRSNMIKKCMSRLSKSQPRVILKRCNNYNEDVENITGITTAESPELKHVHIAPLFDYFLGWTMSLSAIVLLATTTNRNEISNVFQKIVDEDDLETLAEMHSSVGLEGLENMDDHDGFGEVLEERRSGNKLDDNVNLSQRELSSEMSIPTAAISKVEATMEESCPDFNDQSSNVSFDDNDNNDELPDECSNLEDNDLDQSADLTLTPASPKSYNLRNKRSHSYNQLVEIHEEKEETSNDFTNSQLTSEESSLTSDTDMDADGTQIHPKKRPYRRKKMSPRYVMSCEICQMKLHTFKCQKTHFNDYHDKTGMGPEQIFTCTHENCSAYFRTYLQRYLHMRQQHPIIISKTVKLRNGKVVTRQREICPICKAESTGWRHQQKLHFQILHNTEGMTEDQIQRCDLCPAYFVKDEFLIRHKFRHHYESKCPVCGKSDGLLPSGFMRHVQIQHPLVNLFPLLKISNAKEQCGEIETKKDDMEGHIPTNVLKMEPIGINEILQKSNDGSDSPEARDNFLGDELGDKKFMVDEQHVQTHDKNKGYETQNKLKVTRKRNKHYYFSCRQDGCFRYWTKRQAPDFKHHKQIHVMGEFKCNFCDTVEENVAKLSKHEMNNHPVNNDEKNSTDNKLFSCPRCSSQWKFFSQYQLHFAETHIPGFERRGRIIHRRPNRKTVIRCEKKCSRDISTVCEICNQKILSKSQKIHFQINHDTSSIHPDQIEKCSVDNCKAYFKTKVQRQYHVRSQHSEIIRKRGKNRTPSEYAKMNFLWCQLDGCSAKWKSKYSFKEHQRLHSPGHYKCQFCEKVEENVARLCKHEAQHHSTENARNPNYKNNMGFSCRRCSFRSTSMAAYQWHFAETHIPGFEKRDSILHSQPCDICNKRTLKIYRDTHFKKYHDTTGIDSEQILKCKVDDCLAYFKTKLQRYFHVCNEHGIIPNSIELDGHSVAPLEKENNNDKSISTFDCSIANCKESFNTSKNLEIHRKLHGSFKCHFCDVLKEYAPELPLHEMEHAIREPGETSNSEREPIPNPNCFNCPRCPRDFPYEKYYVRHHLLKHLKLSATTRIQICPVCQAESKGGPRFQMLHFKVCHNTEGLSPDEILRCDLCPAYFVKSDQLIDHKAKVHYKMKCPECGKYCGAPNSLRYHVEECHPLVDLFPQLKYPCDMQECRRKFGTKAELDQHKASVQHVGDDDKEMKRSMNKHEKAKHVRTYRKKNPFVCQVCGVKYIHRHNFLNHMKGKHPDVEPVSGDITREPKAEFEDSFQDCESSNNENDFLLDNNELPEECGRFEDHDTVPNDHEQSELTPTKSYNLRQNRKRTYNDSLELDEENNETSDHSEHSQVNSEESYISSDADMYEQEVTKQTKKNQYRRKRKPAGYIKYCDVCKMGFNAWNCQTTHFKNYHDVIGMDPDQIEKCRVSNCKAYFKTKVQRQYHVRSQHPETVRKRGKKRTASEHMKMNFLCCRLDGCNLKWKSKEVFIEHQRLHAPGHYKCDFCDKVEENVTRLCKHEAQNHSTQSGKNASNNNNLSFSCARCSFQSKGLPAYQWHFAETHIPGFEKRDTSILHSNPCEICGKRMIKIYESTHFKKYHDTTGIDPELILKCKVNDCSAYFKTKLQRYSHVLKQHGIIPKNIELDEELVAPREKDNDKSNTSFVCAIANCEESFDTAKNLEAHKKLHGSFNCHFCEVTKEYAPELALHEMEHTIREPGETSTWKMRLVTNPNGFNCPRCPQNFPYEKYYVRHHLMNHLKLSATTRIQICSICQAESKGGKDFQLLHFQICHNTEGLDPDQIVRCDLCPAYFVRTDQLIDHKAKVHYKRKCPECGKCFVAPSNLKLHVEERHPLVDIFPTLKFPCDMANCRRKFGTEAERDRHKTKDMHFDDEELKCSKCGKIFTDRTKLLHHMNSIHPQTSLICNECGKSFKSMNKLNTHLEFHKGPDAWEFQCSTCGKKCFNKYKLAEHVRTHTKEKPFVCQVCGEKYAHRHNMLNHMRTKHPEEFNEMGHESGKRKKAGTNFLSRKGSKKGECITAGKKQP